MRRTTLRAWGLVPGVLLTALPATAQQGGMTVDAARTHLASMARSGGYWAASNAAYATQAPGEPAEYRMRFIASDDGYTMRGCMWARVDGTDRLFWSFFSGWDPGEQAIFQYQVHPAGIVGRGWLRPGSDGQTESIETTYPPGGPSGWSRHLNRAVHPDTIASRSFGGSPDAWVPRREYTWAWRASPDETPCT